jgi:hypothetical protein
MSLPKYIKSIIKPPPNIFILIDKYTKDSKKTQNKLIKYIKKNPKSLFEKHDEMPVYSYATLKGIDCLIDIHETFIGIHDLIMFDGILPYEMINKINGYRPIHYAASNNLKGQLEYLTEEIGVDINAKDKMGNTALHLACLLKNRGIVKILIDNRYIDIDALNKDLQTPLYISAIAQDTYISTLLLEKGAALKKTIKGKSRKFEIDIFSEVKSRKLKKIIKLFDKYYKKQEKSIKFKKIRDLYKDICLTIKDYTNEELALMGIQLNVDTFKKDKKEFCKKLAEQIIIYAQNPEIHEGDD